MFFHKKVSSLFTINNYTYIINFKRERVVYVIKLNALTTKANSP